MKTLFLIKVTGNGSVYILAMMFTIFFVLLFKAMLDKERMYVTYDAVDDAIVSSLIAASPVNLTEYGLSNHLVIYDDVTPLPVPPRPGAPVLTEVQRLAQEEIKAMDFLTHSDLFSPTTDAHLNGAYNAFLSSLVTNLKLDGGMNATISGIDGTVIVTDFSIYNMYEYYDKKTGNRLHYRFIRYSYDGATWSAYGYPLDTDVTVFNSFDDTFTTLDSTAIAANLNFRVMVTDNNGWLGLAGAVTRDINYQRLVDVTD